MSEGEKVESYGVLVNAEGQYSLWPAGKSVPGGWEQKDITGTKEECMAYVDRVWADMRPRSLRDHMKDSARNE